MRELRVHNLPRFVSESELSGSTVVVLDLLRASTTICQALASGAVNVAPFLEVDEALVAASRDRAHVVLGGERHGQRIAGFDLGNSPSEYTPSTVRGKRVFITTTNGTRALHHARLAHRIVVGALVNLSAVATSVENAARVDILCAGTGGAESREDVLAAGALVERLCANDTAAWKLNDAAKAALTEWRSRGDNLAEELRSTPGGQNLFAIGMDHDLVDCAKVDSLTVVPELDVSAWRITR